MTFLEQRDCPACGRDQSSSRIEIQANVPAELLSYEELKEFFIGFRRQQCFFSYYRCRCGILWCPKYFSQSGLDSLYASMPGNVSVSGERDSKRTQVGYVKMLESLGPIQSPVLEYGADIGNFLGEVIRLQPGVTLAAIEPNHAVHGSLRDQLGKNGQLYVSDEEVPLSFKPKTAVAIHVLDHLIEPRSMLMNLVARSEGHLMLFVVVHDESSSLRRLLGPRWAPFCLQHPQVFQSRSLTFMLESVGFKVRLIRKTKNWISLRQSAALGQSIGLFPETLIRFVPAFTFPIRLGNIAIWADFGGSES